MNKKEHKLIYDLCVDVMAHSELDMEITLYGNGINCSEANAVIRYLMFLLKIEVNDEDVEKRCDELMKEYN